MGKTEPYARLEEQRDYFDHILSQGNHMLVTQKLPNIVVRSLPTSTCFFGIHCNHRGQPEPGTYRFSVERGDHAEDAARPIEMRGVKSLSMVMRSPGLMGHGRGGQVWVCVTCYEALLDGSLYRDKFSVHQDEPKLHQLITWLHYIVPETRSLPGFPGMITLTSPQRHTVYLWRAVHFWLVYLCENPNVKQLLDDGRYVEKAFPSDLYPALNSAEALYVDEESRNFRGYSPSGKLAELNWVEVLEKKLSDSLKMSDDLVDYLESEGADTSCEESEASHEESFDEEESRRSEEDGDDGEASASESTEASPEQEPDATRAPSHCYPNTLSTNPGLDTTRPKAVEIPPRGQKRDREGTPITVTAVNTHEIPQDSSPMTSIQSQEGGAARSGIVQAMANDPGVQEDPDSESEDGRIKRAKLAWTRYFHGSHCF